MRVPHFPLVTNENYVKLMLKLILEECFLLNDLDHFLATWLSIHRRSTRVMDHRADVQTWRSKDQAATMAVYKVL